MTKPSGLARCSARLMCVPLASLFGGRRRVRVLHQSGRPIPHRPLGTSYVFITRAIGDPLIPKRLIAREENEPPVVVRKNDAKREATLIAVPDSIVERRRQIVACLRR